MPSGSIERYSALPLFLELRVRGQHLSYATGFVADAPCGPVLVTCRHVFTGRDNQTGKPLSNTAALPDEVLIRHNGGDSDDRVSMVVSIAEPILSSDGKPLWYEHPTLGARADLAALPIRVKPPIVLVKSSLGEGDPKIVCRPSEPVSVIGFPFGKSGPGQFGIWSTGFVASEMSILFDGLPVFLIDCRSRPGQSGSPVVAYRTTSAITEDGGVEVGTGVARSRFIGVYSGRIHAESDIGMVWSAAAVRELVHSAGAAQPIIPADSAKA